MSDTTSSFLFPGTKEKLPINVGDYFYFVRDTEIHKTVVDWIVNPDADAKQIVYGITLICVGFAVVPIGPAARDRAEMW